MASSASTTTSTLQQQQHGGNIGTSGGGGSGTGGGGTRRRGSDRSLSGSAHELAVCGVREISSTSRVPHSHSQSNLTDIPYRYGGHVRMTIISKLYPSYYSKKSS